jgi:hypothetical protein
MNLRRGIAQWLWHNKTDNTPPAIDRGRKASARRSR